MIYVLYVIVAASAGWTTTSATVTTHPSEAACGAAADQARHTTESVITYCVRMHPAAQRTTHLEGMPNQADVKP